MNDSSNNIKLSYLYRDAGNYKLFGEEVFSNPENLMISEIETRIKSNLIDGEFFVAEEWGLVPLKFEETDDELDHDWHEYEGLEITENQPTNSMTMQEFIFMIDANKLAYFFHNEFIE